MKGRAVVLMGFMGTGKSEVGRRLAQRLGRSFVDTDHAIEERAGKRVAAIFADDGEAAFRRLEREAVADAASRGGVVIAVGGGAVLDPENVRRLRDSGVLVHLTARPEIIVRRVGDGGGRPLLRDDPRAAVTRLLAERGPAYAAVADVTIDTSERNAGQVVEEIQQALERSERWKSST
ncbi:MAG: shikimate kinase [Deltaproteobacteria bacterium]|nr:shikimate kinase [Deltaproteobacteria bacterium]